MFKFNGSAGEFIDFIQQKRRNLSLFCFLLLGFITVGIFPKVHVVLLSLEDRSYIGVDKQSP